MAPKCPKVGLRVKFVPTFAAAMFYDKPHDPKVGATGTVTTVSLGSKKASCLHGPRGGMVYVDWDNSPFVGVFKNDLVREDDGSALKGLPGGRRRSWRAGRKGSRRR